jgi:nicotinamidase-related amidase
MIKLCLCLLLVALPAAMATAQEPVLDKATTLVIVDVQDFYFPGGKLPLVEPEMAAANAARVLGVFREKGQPVVHVRHNFEPGGEINRLVAPAEGEKIITKDHANSFRDTGLQMHLENLGARRLVICGMQTHMCVEAMTRAAADLGYECLVIHDACATRDLVFAGEKVPAAQVHASTLASLGAGYARLLATQEFLELVE